MVSLVKPTRVRGSRNGPLWVAVALAAVFAPGIAASIAGFGLHWDQAAFASPFVLMLVRASTMGVFVGPEEIRIRSWWWNKRIKLERVRCLEIDGYSGSLNRGSQSPLDPLYRYCRMLVLTIGGGEREYPETICSREVARRIQDAVLAARPETTLLSGEHGSPPGKRRRH